MRKKLSNQLPDYAKYSTIAFTMAVIIAGGIFAGVELDKYVKTGFPLFTLLFSVGSVSLAIYFVVRDLKKPTKKNEKNL